MEKAIESDISISNVGQPVIDEVVISEVPVENVQVADSVIVDIEGDQVQGGIR